MVTVPTSPPKEFRDDVVVALHGDAPLSQIARDFGISRA
jgi:transposase-like protein